MAHGIGWPWIGLGEELYEIQSPERAEQQKHSQHEAEVADPIDDERFLPRVRSRFFQEVETDEQITREPHALPTNEEQHVILSQHQDEHEEHEQVQIRKEAVVPALMHHVSGRVNVDQPADTRDNHEHHHGQLIHLKVEACAEITRSDPRKVLLYPGNLLRRELKKLTHRFERAEKR